MQVVMKYLHDEDIITGVYIARKDLESFIECMEGCADELDVQPLLEDETFSPDLKEKEIKYYAHLLEDEKEEGRFDEDIIPNIKSHKEIPSPILRIVVVDPNRPEDDILLGFKTDESDLVNFIRDFEKYAVEYYDGLTYKHVADNPGILYC